jgi:hypothetical protein
METHNSYTKSTRRKFIAFSIVAATICFSIIATIASSVPMTMAQGQPSSQPNPNAPLSFFLKLGNNQSTSAASSQAASNGTGTKNITIAVNVQKGPTGSPMKLPISAVVPKNVNPQDLQLCASLQNGQQKCQPLTQNAPNIDLSSAPSGAASTTPQSYHDGDSIGNILSTLSSRIIQYADAQLISVNNTTLNIPITVIVPITLEIQNAQICASVASSGGVSCQQLVLNPTQSAFTPVNVDLSNPTTPTVSTLSASVPSTQQLTGGATGSNNTGALPSNATTGGTNATTGGTNATTGGTNATGTNTSGTTANQGSQTPSNTTQTAQQNAPEQGQQNIPSSPTGQAQEKNSGSDKSNSDKSNSKSDNGN